MNRLKRFARLMSNLYDYERGAAVCHNLPTRIFIEPTNICNLRCVMCAAKDIPRERKGHMEFELFRKIIDEGAGFLHDVNLFFGGEPFAHPRIVEMIAYIKAKGLGVRIHTNGTLMSDKFSAAILDAGVDLLSFSVDGYDRETYNKIRVNAEYDTTMAKLRDFLELKKRRGAARPQVIIQTLVLDEAAFNEAEYNRFKADFAGLPVDKFLLQFPHNWAGQLDTDGKSTSRKKVYKHCMDPWFFMAVLWNGELVPCCNDYSGAYHIGNVKDISLKEAWNGEAMVRLRRALTSNPPEHEQFPLCAGCDRLYEERIFGIPLRNLRYFKLTGTK